MPWRTITTTRYRTVTKYRDVIKEEKLGYTEIPVHRPKILYFEFEGMRPNTPHWIFFGNKEITKYCNTSYTLSDYTSAGRTSKIKEPGDSFVTETQFPASLGGPSGNTSTGITSNADGSIKGFFYLQSNATTYFQPLTDGNNFSALDISVHNRDESLSYAATKFYGFGQYEDWYEYTTTEAYQTQESYTVIDQVWEDDDDDDDIFANMCPAPTVEPEFDLPPLPTTTYSSVSNTVKPTPKLSSKLDSKGYTPAKTTYISDWNPWGSNYA